MKNKVSKVNIERIKQFLIDYYKVKTWEQCIEKQQYGDCDKVCRIILKNFPNIFNKYALDISFDFSPIAIKQLNDDKDMFGNHYVLTKGGEIYDFARGCNCLDGVYLMTHQLNNKDKYNIIFTKEEKNLIYGEIKRNLLGYKK